MDIKVIINKEEKENNKASWDVIGFTGAMAALFFLFSYYNQHLFFNGNHSQGIVMTMVVSALVATIFLFVFFALLFSRFGD